MRGVPAQEGGGGAQLVAFPRRRGPLRAAHDIRSRSSEGSSDSKQAVFKIDLMGFSKNWRRKNLGHSDLDRFARTKVQN